jgi:hypothetical protein
VLKLNEIYQTTVKYESLQQSDKVSMQRRTTYESRECMLNPDYIVAIYPHYFESSSDRKMLADKFKGTEQFARIVLDGNSFRSSEIIVSMSYEKLARLLVET